MARLYVVAFSKQHRRVRHLANPLRCAYNPDSPLGAPPLRLPISPSVADSIFRRFNVPSQIALHHHGFAGKNFAIDLAKN